MKEVYGIQSRAELPHHDPAGRGRHPAHDRARARDDRARCCRTPTSSRRQPVSVGEISLALQCGGSDGYSGITANPALGHCADLLVRNGGTAILSETPEIYGAEHLLTRRAVSHARSPTSWSSGSTGGRSIASATAAR